MEHQNFKVLPKVNADTTHFRYFHYSNPLLDPNIVIHSCVKNFDNVFQKCLTFKERGAEITSCCEILTGQRLLDLGTRRLEK